MADRVEVHDVTCPANTLASAAIEIAFGDPPAIPRKATIIIPDGHAGTTGIALGYGHQPVLPRRANAFISGNDEVINFELSNYPIGPPWSVFVCNLDYLSHVWEVRMEYDEIRVGQGVSPTTVLSVDDIIKAGEDLALRTQQSAITPAAIDLSTIAPEQSA